jgi:AcrR family transcriptional regulator
MKRKPKGGARRQAILNAAEALVRDTRSTDFSMLTLAKRAGVSPATPYNAFGTKDSILYVLLNQSLDGVFSSFEEVAEDVGPYETVLAAADAAARFFLLDPDFYQPLYQHLIGVQDPVHRPAYMDRALQYWRVALSGLSKAGYLSGEVERDALARGMMIQFVGAMDMWAQSELSSEVFSAHILHGVSCLLMGNADQEAQRVLRKVQRKSLAVMPKHFSFNRVAAD